MEKEKVKKKNSHEVSGVNSIMVAYVPFDFFFPSHIGWGKVIRVE